MKLGLAASAVLVCAPLAARADALLEVGAHGIPQPASQLIETACEVDVEVHAGLATVELRQHLTNTGSVALAGGYELAVPAGAALIGASIRDGSAADDAAVGVRLGFATTLASDRDVVGADPLMIVPIDADDPAGRPRYRATLQPIEGGHATVLTTRWATAVTVDAGALQVSVPGRDGEGRLPACHGSVHAVAGPGATVTRIRAASGAGTGASASFTLADADVPIAVELAFARPEPLVWTQREDLGAGWTSELVTVVAPPARSSAPVARRAMFVVDGSRSMDMVGPAAVAKVVDAVAAALPPGTELDAIVYDRTAARVLGSWQPADRAVGVISAAVEHHVAVNGSDLEAALRVAHDALADGQREQTTIIVITDGVLGQLPDTALVDALAANPSAVDVHAIILDPGATRSPGKALLARPVSLYGGSYVEVGVEQLDAALAGVDAWVRPAWVDVALHGPPDRAHGELPSPLRAGAGGTELFVTRGAGTVVLAARAEVALKVAGRATPVGAPGALGALALALTSGDDFAAGDTAAEHAAGARAREVALAEHPIADAEHALVALAAAGPVAQHRRAMVAGGGPYTRLAAIDEPAWAIPVARAHAAAPAPSAIERITLERLFRDQLQPAAYVCYEHALGLDAHLGGTVRFDLHLARGEVTHAAVSGVGDAAFSACLVDAAYRMTPPLPDLRVNSDDQTVVHYPLTFNLADHHPTIILGDADSSSPLDIDAIEGGVPGGRRGPVHVDTANPLGGIAPR